jgi:phosphate:Na+ symporter
VVDQPRLALASAKRELVRMAEIVERMLAPVMELYETGDPARIAEVRKLELAVNRAQSEIKLYLSRIAYADDMMEEARRGRDLAGFAINLEHVGDAITKTLLKLAETRRDQGLKFSPAGWRELKELHDRALSNMRLAFNVLVSEDREAARQLIAQQTAMDRAGNASAASHLDRLRSGTPQSIATSNLHLETVRALNTVATLLTPIAHQILERSQGEPDGHNSA